MPPALVSTTSLKQFMPKLNARDLTGFALDYAVAQALKFPIVEEGGYVVWDGEPPEWLVDLLDLEMDGGRYDTPAWCPSTDVGLGMQLIWRAKIATFADGDGWRAVPASDYNAEGGYIDASWNDGMGGDTPLVAGCRVLVESILGVYVEIPAALVGS